VNGFALTLLREALAVHAAERLAMAIDFMRKHGSVPTTRLYHPFLLESTYFFVLWIKISYITFVLVYK
jgi:hypothetical protein